MTSPKLLTDALMRRLIAHGYLCLRTELLDSFHRAIWERFDTLIATEANLNPGIDLLPAVGWSAPDVMLQASHVRADCQAFSRAE
jgi:hypothetical protein